MIRLLLPLFLAASAIGSVTEQPTSRDEQAANRWSHIAVVLDPASRVLTTYIDGVRAAQATKVNATLAQLVPPSATTRLFLGRTQDDRQPSLHGRLRDVRLYRTVLGDEQIATIHRNALAAVQPARGGPPPPDISTSNIPAESPFATQLTNVPDVTVETVVGTLPRLPATVPATYSGGAPGDVRVIWPAPVDNMDVRKPGTYTVTGRVPGTAFSPKATVIVKARVGTFTPPGRLVEAFPLGLVTLDRDSHGRDTPFIKNRDKFLRGLAASST